MNGGADVEARFDAGLRAQRDGRHDEALAAFEAVLEEAPQHVGALVSRGSLLLAARRFEEAEDGYRRALAAEPRQPIALRNLAVLLQTRERYEEALALADAALASDPRHGEALIARGNALSSLGRLEAALDAYRRASQIPPMAHEALIKLGATFGALRRYEPARQFLDAAVALDPTSPLPRFQRGLLRLSLRDFAGGWDDYEERWRSPRFIAESRGLVAEGMIPELTVRPAPEDLAGQRVLLVAEQGIGDQVMFASMIPDLARTAASVVCVCDDRLVRLFRASFPDVAFFPAREAKVDKAAIDRLLALGSLGAAFRRGPADFPATAYLEPSDDVRGRWAERLGPRTTRRRIGISWRGGAPTTRQNARSLTLPQLAPLLAVADCEFVSLQYGDVADELAPFPDIRSFGREDIEDFEELAGLVANLDAVVSVQTALVHLCGALGGPCLALVPRQPEWRYMAEGHAMPWYGSVRLLRQGDDGDWGPVVARAAQALRAG